MEIKKILENLCYYDKRNPNNVLDEDDELDIEDFNFDSKAFELWKEGKHPTIKNKNLKIKDCYCGNCFNGKTKLAEELLKYIKK